jgi:hypothetical protein
MERFPAMIDWIDPRCRAWHERTKEPKKMKRQARATKGEKKIASIFKLPSETKDALSGMEKKHKHSMSYLVNLAIMVLFSLLKGKSIEEIEKEHLGKHKPTMKF